MTRSRALRYGGSLLGLAALAVVLSFPAPSAAGTRTTFFHGQFACNDRGVSYPLANARVELWQRGWDWLPKWATDSLITVHTADDEGRVRNMGGRVKDKDDFYLRVQLSSDGVRAEDWWAPWAWFADTSTHYSNRAEQDFGTKQLGNGAISPECAPYEGVRRAYQGYRGEVGQRPPGGNVTIAVNSPFTSGVPLAPYLSIFWPPRYPPATKPGGFETASHEFAHTVRHGFDGNLEHFLGDVVGLNYLQQHGACKRTNPGFAFNEGWAEYWAGDFDPAPNCPGIPATDYSVEGNVAAALTGLERECVRVNRKRMVEVLARNPGRIHSFDDFRRALGCLQIPTAVRAKYRGPAAPVTRRLQISVAKGQVRALRSTAGRLTRRLRTANRAARRPLPCRQRPCIRALRRAVSPALIGAELGQARLLQKTISPHASSRGLKRMGTPGTQRFQRRLNALKRGFRLRSAKLGKRAVVDALKAARPILRRDKSAQVKGIAKGMRGALRDFRAGRLPAGFAIPTPGPSSRLRRRAPLPSPARPTPIPRPPAAVPQPKPDLVIDRVYAVFNTDRSEFEARVDVRNSGPVTAPASKTGITGVTTLGAPELLLDTPPLAPGQSTTVRAPCPTGTNSASARADATNLVNERDETNNTRAAQLSCVFGDVPSARRLIGEQR